MSVRENGRWASDSSLKTYLDLISASDIYTKLLEAGFSDLLKWIKKGWAAYFSPAILCQEYAAKRDH